MQAAFNSPPHKHPQDPSTGDLHQQNQVPNPHAPGPYGYPYREQMYGAWSAVVPAVRARFGARELLTAVVWVALFNLAFYRYPGGFGFSIAFAIAPWLLFAALPNARKGRLTIWLLGALSLLAARLLVAPNYTSMFCAVCALALFALSLRLRSPQSRQIAWAFLTAVPRACAGLGQLAGAVLTRLKVRSPSKALIVVGAPLAIGSTFVAIFALANPVVASGLSRLANSIALPDFGEVCFCLLALGGFAFAARPSLSKRAIAKAPEALRSTLRDTLATNALAVLNLVFFAYNALDAVYLWGGRTPPGMDNQAYAHAGAFWLTFAMMLVSAITLALFRRSAVAPSRWLRLLAFAWIAQSGVLALGTLRRMWMHVATSGLSDLRIFGFFGVAVVVATLGLVFDKVRRNQAAHTVGLRLSITAAIAFVLYAVAPTHLVATGYNVARIYSGDLRPLIHLREQAAKPESTLALLPLLEHADPEVQAGVAALLLREVGYLERDTDALHDRRSLAGFLVHAQISSTQVLIRSKCPDAERALQFINRRAVEENYGTRADWSDDIR